MTVDYITDAEFRAYINDTGSDDAANIANAITSASRVVDSYCGRRFYAAVETQYFSADYRRQSALWILPLGDMDIAAADGSLAVRSETGNDGTYPDVWTVNVDFILEPVNQSENGIIGWPYTSLRAIGGKVWPIRFIPWQRDTVKITANFGWLAIPEPVKRATKIIAAQQYKLADAPLGVAGWGAYGDIKVRDIPQVSTLLAPYRKSTSIGVA